MLWGPGGPAALRLERPRAACVWSSTARSKAWYIHGFTTPPLKQCGVLPALHPEHADIFSEQSACQCRVHCTLAQRSSAPICTVSASQTAMRALMALMGLEAMQEETAVSAGAAEGEQFPVQVHLSSGVSYGCDLVVSATGVLPDTSWLPSALARDSEGSLLVDRCAWPAQ